MVRLTSSEFAIVSRSLTPTAPSGKKLHEPASTLSLDGESRARDGIWQPLPLAWGSAQEMTGTPPIGAPPVDVPQTVGAPGSPHATTTIDGRYLPPPPQPFPGQIELKEGRWPARFGTPFVLLTPSAP